MPANRPAEKMGGLRIMTPRAKKSQALLVCLIVGLGSLLAARVNAQSAVPEGANHQLEERVKELEESVRRLQSELGGEKSAPARGSVEVQVQPALGKTVAGEEPAK